MSENRNKNPRLTPKDYGLIKSALRRAFVRSALHQSIMDAGHIEHSDPLRPRCKRWTWCQLCGLVFPRYLADVDHIEPFVEIGSSFQDMDLAEAVDRLWCDPGNLQRICPTCHNFKSDAEREARKALAPPKVKKPRKAAKGKS